MVVRKDNKTIISFKTSPTDLVCGSRRKHLANKEFVVAETNENGDFTYHWDQIFINND